MSKLSVTLLAFIWIPPSHLFGIIWVQEETSQANKNWEGLNNHERNFALLPRMTKLVSACSIDATLFLASFLFLILIGWILTIATMVTSVIFVSTCRKYMIFIRIGQWYKIQWFRHAWIHSTPIMNRLTSFFARYMSASSLVLYLASEATKPRYTSDH